METNSPIFRRFPVLGSACVLFAVGGYWFYSPESAPIPADLSKPLVASSEGAERVASVPQVPPSAPSLTSVASGAGVRRLFGSVGPVAGVPLPTEEPVFRNGAEKGRILPVEKFSPEMLADLSAGDSVAIPTPEGEMEGVVNLVQGDENGWVRVGGDLAGRSGTFLLSSSADSAGGNVLLPEERRAYELVMDSEAGLQVIERRLSDLQCLAVGQGGGVSGIQAAGGGSAAVPVAGSLKIPVLSSRPSAPAVVYLDFDGETVTDPGWLGGRTIVAPALSLTETQVTEIFNRVKEDFLPFNIDITTDPARYAAVPANRRMRCIVTSPDALASKDGGLALVGSFSMAGGVLSTTVPCWVFNSSVLAIAEAISHEVGHTLGLDHDGRVSPVERYYAGEANKLWAPIMGVGYYSRVVQWSKGEYANASNLQDDLEVIASRSNGFGYAADDVGNTISSASSLGLLNGNIRQSGEITGTWDQDVFAFNALGGPLAVTASPAAVSPNLDIKLELLNSAGAVLAVADPAETQAASFSATLSAGTHYLRVSGTGTGDPRSGGYSKYGSLGAYTLNGTVNGTSVSFPPAITSSGTVSGEVGRPFAYQITATRFPSSYRISGKLPAGLVLNPATGLISGTPTEVGNFSVTVGAVNSNGTGILPAVLAIARFQLQLPEALDFSQGTVSSMGDLPWVGQDRVTRDGVDAAESGRISHNQNSVLAAVVTGPAILVFRWKVDSEAGHDILSVSLNGDQQQKISGTTDWSRVRLKIPAGKHRVRWRYEKDASVSAGADAGWVDMVSLRSVQAAELEVDDNEQ